MIDEVAVTEKVIDRKFQMLLGQRGKNTFRAFIFSGDGQIDGSFNREVQVV